MKRLNLKKKKMFESVYVCRDTYCSKALIIPADIGIVKLEGCVAFYPATKIDGDYGNENDCDEWISYPACRGRYGAIPSKGTAWLVEEGRKYINWTRVDHNLHLLNANGSIVKQ